MIHKFLSYKIRWYFIRKFSSPFLDLWLEFPFEVCLSGSLFVVVFRYCVFGDVVYLYIHTVGLCVCVCVFIYSPVYLCCVLLFFCTIYVFFTLKLPCYKNAFSLCVLFFLCIIHSSALNVRRNQMRSHCHTNGSKHIEAKLG